MNGARTLKQLGAALRGQAPADADWMALIELANRAMVTPSVFRALEAGGALAAAPEDAAAFMAEVTARSQARNLRLLQTAADAITALNAAGIEPVLLKGMALWAELPAGAPFARIMSDVDLMVRPDEAAAAVVALQGAGFGLMASYEGSSTHVTAELGRPSDVGLVDLHQRPPGPPGLAAAFDADRHARTMQWQGRVRTPFPAHQIYLMCLHDQFHDGGYWRGGFDLRHLHDIAELTRLPGGVDWEVLDEVIPTRLVRNAVHAELIAAREIAGAVIPDRIGRRWTPRLQYRRHLAQHVHPRWNVVLAGLGLALEWPNVPQHRAVNRAGWRRANGASDRRWGYRPSRIKGLMKMRGGKI